MFVTVYFLRQNLRGLHESSDKAMKIMWATSAMAVILLVWCGVSLVFKGAAQGVPWQPDLNQKVVHLELKPNEGESLEQFRQRLRDQGIDDKRFTDLELEGGINVQDLSRPDHLKPEPAKDEPNVDPRRVNGKGEILQDNESFDEANAILLPDKPPTEQYFRPADPLGWLGQYPAFGFLRIVGVLGLFLAFGHSILAMSGEETLAQVYREVEAPKLPNFKKAAFIVFVYSLVLTAGISFLAVILIPDEVRMKFYSGNLIGGLSRHVIGPGWLKLVLETFVVVIGFLILAGAVNTAIIGSNGVLNRIAEDGVLPDWFLRPHPKFGTTYRLLYLIAGLQLLVIVGSMGHVIILGEAYAFGVVWSFVFKALSMVVLRFTHREHARIHGAAQHQVRQRRLSGRPVADLPGAVDNGHPELLHQGSGHHRRHRLHRRVRHRVHRLRALPREEAQGVRRRRQASPAHRAVQPGQHLGDHADEPGPEASRTTSWSRSARCRTSSCWKRRWPKPTRRRRTWW